MRVNFTKKSKNAKTGPIPVSTSCASTCPSTCAFKERGCYAAGGPLAILWRKVTEGKAGDDWRTFCAKVESLPPGTLWRHNQAGDLPGIGNEIDAKAMLELVQANEGRKGFTYTHKPMEGVNRLLVQHANEEGFTVNLSADSLPHADALSDLNIAPVVVVLPSDQLENTTTPMGRKVVVCPAVTHEGVTCATCALCASASRRVVIGFPAHGMNARHVSRVVA